MTKKIFINLAGLIAAGKTTISENLSKSLDIPIYYESVADNKILKNFYSHMPKTKKEWGFSLQMKFLLQRKQIHEECSKTGGIIDRSIYEDRLFCNMLHTDGDIRDDDYDLYMDYSDDAFKHLDKPTHILYLKVTPEKALERIKLRNRPNEQGIPLEYLQNLNKEYESFIKEYNPIIIDWNEFQSTKYVLNLL